MRTQLPPSALARDARFHRITTAERFADERMNGAGEERQLALAPDLRRLDIARSMLSKRYEPKAPTIIKANVPVNFMLSALIDPAQADSVLLLYLLHQARPAQHDECYLPVHHHVPAQRRDCPQQGP